jgi:hypothetical protein
MKNSSEALSSSLAFFARVFLVHTAVVSGLILAKVANPSRAQIVPLLAITTIVLYVGLAVANRAVDRHLRALGVRLLVAFHVARFIGAFFLWAHAQGQLPATFAYRAGVGDIVVAVGALLLLQMGPGRSFRRGLLIWNVLGVLDLFMALGTAISLNLTQPGVMSGMATLPWALIPLMLVPMMLATHAKMLVWLWRRPAEVEEVIW